MKKRCFYICLLFLIGLVTPTYAIQKTTGRVSSTTGLKMRSGPGTSYEKVITVPHNVRVVIVSYADGNGCDDKWAEIIYEANGLSYKGYSCSTYIEDIETVDVEEEEDPPKTDTSESEMANMTEEEFEAYLTSQGFPESYKVKLRELHKLHPTWVFKGVKSNYSWTSALNEQNGVGTSLLNVNNSAKEKGLEGYLSTEYGNYDYSTDTFYSHDGMYWYQANNQAIAYYMDPRNFLSEQYIFMFEELLYYPSYQNKDTVNKILTSDFMQQYTMYFLEAAEKYNISPLYLAALSRQEVGLTDTNIVTNGKAGVLSDGVDYTGYYNFFNHGANSSEDPKLKSLQAAKKYNWNTQQISIVEGAYLLSYNYIQCGQYTSYFQKFNVSPTATKGSWHQYTTNITALVSPASTTYNSYNSLGIINKEFSFAIPIFDDMPEKTTLPNLGNPNNWLKELKINGMAITNFSGENTNYTINIPYAESIVITATTVNGKASVIGAGEKELTSDSSSYSIVVTAQNGSTKTYTLLVNREKQDETNLEKDVKVIDVLKTSGLSYDDYYIWNVSLSTNVEGIIKKLTENYKTVSVNVKNRQNQAKNDGTIVTGDKVIISINGESKTLDIIIYGDTNGDGNISAIDLLNVQKHILGYTTLLGPYAKAADINKDSNISAYDLLQVQKHILGYTNISQN